MLFSAIFSHRLHQIDEENARKRDVAIDFVPMTKEQMDKLRKQIAETTLIDKSEKTTDDAFLGQQTQIVREQTRAHTSAPFKEARRAAAPRTAGKQATDS